MSQRRDAARSYNRSFGGIDKFEQGDKIGFGKGCHRANIGKNKMPDTQLHHRERKFDRLKLGIPASSPG